MSLAGKMLHCIHMRNWNEIARRRSELKQMDPRLSFASETWPGDEESSAQEARVCYLEGASLEEGKYVDLEVDGDIMKLILTASDAQKGLPKLLRVQEGAETARDPGLACTRALQVSFFYLFLFYFFWTWSLGSLAGCPGGVD